MVTREFGSSGLRVSALALGCWPIAGVGWTGVNEQDSLATIRQALDVGINFVDTAYMYGLGGESEILVGKAIAGRRAEVVLATKCGVHWDGGKAVRDSSSARIQEECEASLRRLNVDAIDLYQVHAPDPGTSFQETAQALERLLRQGKIRAIGVSNFDVAQMQEFSRHAPLHSLQPAYSMIRREIERDILPYCEEHRIGVCVYCPLERGLLTDGIRPGESYPAEDSRRQNSNFLGDSFARTRQMVMRLQSIARENGMTLAQLVLNWTVHQPGVTVAIVGATRPHQVLENAHALGRSLTADQMERIRKIVESR
ncbi:MAG: aldo/keto reductase [Planctomycetes bacterium]|nr:aldo/keto reductase [Planctomycetota bacterium]